MEFLVCFFFSSCKYFCIECCYFIFGCSNIVIRFRIPLDWRPNKGPLIADSKSYKLVFLHNLFTIDLMTLGSLSECFGSFFAFALSPFRLIFRFAVEKSAALFFCWIVDRYRAIFINVTIYSIYSYMSAYDFKCVPINLSIDRIVILSMFPLQCHSIECMSLLYTIHSSHSSEQFLSYLERWKIICN